MEYTAKITKKGQITIPVVIRHLKNWKNGDCLVFKLDANNNVEIYKQVNLYDTEWGHYDFKKAVNENPELSMSDYPVGREGWQDAEK